MAPAPLKIVVINDASVARGGATGLALLSMRLMRARGLAVTYICGDAGENEELVALGVDVVSLGGRHIMAQGRLSAFVSGLYNDRARKLLSRWIAANDTPGTVYHVHGWSKILSPSIFGALENVAPRTVIHAHDFFLSCPNGAFMDYRREEGCLRVPLGSDCLSTNCDKRSYAQKLWRSARTGLLRQTLDVDAGWAAFAMIHDSMAPFLEKGGLPAARLVTVRNPAERLSAERVRVEENAAMVFIGRVEAEKGIVQAIEAARAAGVPMQVIGDGPLREKLAAENPQIEFLGWRSRGEMAELVKTARFLVMPSRYPEPFGLVAVEASTSGLPVLISHTAFLAREIVDGGLGLAVDVSDPQAFREAVTKLRDLAPDAIEQMSLRAFSGEVRLSTSPDEWIVALLELYESAMEVSRHSREMQHAAAG